MRHLRARPIAATTHWARARDGNKSSGRVRATEMRRSSGRRIGQREGLAFSTMQSLARARAYTLSHRGLSRGIHCPRYCTPVRSSSLQFSGLLSRGFSPDGESQITRPYRVVTRIVSSRGGIMRGWNHHARSRFISRPSPPARYHPASRNDRSDNRVVTLLKVPGTYRVLRPGRAYAAN